MNNLEIKELLTTCNYWQGNGSKKPKINQYIVIHYVGRVSTAENNAKCFYNNYKGASANYFVDENDIYRVVKDSDTAWHCGTTGAYIHPKCRNTNSIGIEMCCFKNNGKLDVSETNIGIIFSSFSIANILIIPCLPTLLHYLDKRFLFWFSLLIEVKLFIYI
jgi:N-acetyl-anhydromuramyl-L-alanine amidase AmpD